MKAQRPFGLAVSWPRITAVFLVDVAVLSVASHCPDAWQNGHTAWWVGVGLAALVAIVALPTYSGIPLASAPVVRVRDGYADPAALLADCSPTIDHARRFGRDVVGVREHQGRLVTVIAVHGPLDAPSGRHRPEAVSAATLPVDAVAATLRQFDVRLDGVDIVSVGTRRGHRGRGDGESTLRDDPGDVDDHRPLDQRSTWLVLRMDPQRNVAAVAARDSLAATFAAATERLAHDLDGRRCAAQPLNAAEVAEVDDAVLADLEPTQVRSHWRYLTHPGGYVTSFWVSPRDITAETLDRLWLTDTDVTVVTIRLTPRRDGAAVSAWVRYHSDERLGANMWRGLNRLTGRQWGAVGASLPAPTGRRPLVLPSRRVDDREALAVPLGPAPQYATGRMG